MKKPDIIWQSEWNGDEVGYPEIPVVALYRIAENKYCYVDSETGMILEHWKEDDEG